MEEARSATPDAPAHRLALSQSAISGERQSPTRSSLSPSFTRLGMHQDVPRDSFSDDDELFGSQAAVPMASRPQRTSSIRSHASSVGSNGSSSVFDLRISMHPTSKSDRRRSTWMTTNGGERDSIPDLPGDISFPKDLRASSVSLAAIPSSSSSRTLTPSEAPVEHRHSYLNGATDLRHGSQSSPPEQGASLVDTSAPGYTPMAPEAGRRADQLDLGVRSMSAPPDRNTATHPLPSSASSLRPALDMSGLPWSAAPMVSSPAASAPSFYDTTPSPSRYSSGTFTTSRSYTFEGGANRHTFLGSSQGLGSSLVSPLASEPPVTLDFGEEAGLLLGEGFGDFGSGLAESLGAGLDLSFTSEPEAPTPPQPADETPDDSASVAQSDYSKRSQLLKSLSDFPRLSTRDRSDSASTAASPAKDSFSRPRTPSLPISPTAASHFSTNPKPSFEARRSRLGSDLSASNRLSPEPDSSRGHKRSQTPVQALEGVISSLKGHMRKVSGSDGAESAMSSPSRGSGRHQRNASQSSLHREQSSPSVRHLTPSLSHGHESSATSASTHTPPLRGLAQMYLQQQQAGGSQTPQREAEMRPAPIDKSLPPTPGMSSRFSGPFQSSASVPPLPLQTAPSTSQPAVDFGSLRKNAALALKKSKGLLRSKKPDPLLSTSTSDRFSVSNARSADDAASIASFELPITLQGTAAQMSSSNPGANLPPGASIGAPKSVTRPRASSESKHSISVSQEMASAPPPVQPQPPIKHVQQLRRGSDASATGAPSGPRAVPLAPSASTISRVPEPRTVPKQPSTSELLDAATAKLYALVAAAQAASASNGSSRDSFAPDPLAPSSPSVKSSTSSPPTEEHATVTKAIRVQPGSNDSPSSPQVVMMPKRALVNAARVQPGPEDKPVAAEPKRTLSARRPAPKRSASKQSVTSAGMTDKPLSPVAAAAARPLPPPPVAVQAGPFWRKRKITFDTAGASSSMLSPAWVEIEGVLIDYRRLLAEGSADRTNKVTLTLLPFLKGAETGEERITAPGPQARRQREVLFAWLRVLIEELRDAPSNRGVCLEGVAGIVESRFLCSEALPAGSEDERRYTDALVEVLAFAVDRLNEKAVYANTLAFSGRMLALAFFRIEGVAIKLLRLLPQVKRMELRRIIEEAGYEANKLPKPTSGIFPAHLDSLCYRDLQSYCALMTPLAPNENADLVATEAHKVTMAGNWLIRWCASDSDLPFAFYRAYHRQLASYLRLPDLQDPNPEAFVPIVEALTAPGYLFVAASLLEKAESLVHRNMRSVTTLGPNSGSFNTLDSATMSTGAKPKVLEMANRRVVSTMLDIVGGPASRAPAPGEAAPESPEGLARRRFFGGILQLWLRAIVKRTSLFDPRGIFLLLDFLESVFYAVCSPAPPPSGERVPYKPSVDALVLLDAPFVMSMVKTVLQRADNTVVLMRTVAFLYSLFDIFTLRHVDREQLCDHMLLNSELFQRLFLFWNTSVRGYFQRLVVWRLSRLGQTSDGRPPSTKDPWIFQTLQTLNLRLEGIRKRHNELDPLDDLADDDLFIDRRLSVSSTRGVTNQPWAVEEISMGGQKRFSRSIIPDELPPLPSSDQGSRSSGEGRESDEWRRMARTESSQFGSLGSNKAASKVVNWLKITMKPAARALGGVGRTSRSDSVDGHRVDPYALDISMPAETVDPSQRSPLLDDDTAIAYADFPVRAESSESSPVLDHESTPATTTEAELDGGHEVGYAEPDGAQGPSFFKFEFETDAPRSDAFDGRKSLDARKSVHSVRSIKSFRSNPARDDDADSVYPAEGARSPRRRPMSGVSPRVSKRFSKRASILPPPAIDLLFDTSEPVPAIPAQFREQSPYEARLHPYAVRGLREYEESLDELEIWLLRVKDEDEELADRDLADLVPRLGVAWPVSFDDS